MAEVLYGAAVEFAGLRGSERVFDLYCGIGTIGLSLASRAREVVGVEIVEAAVADAIDNARRNEITNARFFAGDIRLAMRELVEQAGKPDVAVIDPPRAGLSQKVVRRIVEAAPKRIVYVSCNPTTLAPNAAQLVEAGYELQRVRPVDMFPQTPHIECVALLERARTSGRLRATRPRAPLGGEAAQRAGDRAVGAGVEAHAAVRGADLDARRRPGPGTSASRRSRPSASRARRSRPPAGTGRRARRGSARSTRRAGSATRTARAPRRCRAPRRRRPGRARAGAPRAGTRTGEPSATTPATRSGRRAASALANTPPRLWPMIDDAVAGPLGERLEPLLQPRARRLRAATFARIPARLVCQPAPRSHCVIVAERAVAGQEAGDQQHAAARRRRARPRRGARRSAAAPPTRARTGPRATAAARRRRGCRGVRTACTVLPD